MATGSDAGGRATERLDAEAKQLLDAMPKEGAAVLLDEPTVVWFLQVLLDMEAAGARQDKLRALFDEEANNKAPAVPSTSGDSGAASDDVAARLDELKRQIDEVSAELDALGREYVEMMRHVAAVGVPTTPAAAAGGDAVTTVTKLGASSAGSAGGTSP